MIEIFSMITSNPLIISELYLKYGILHYRDDWGQCLYHLLSLGKTQDVEFNCFTLGYPNVDIRYRVWIFPGQTYLGVSETTANIYIKLVGEKGETGKVIGQSWSKMGGPENDQIALFTDHRRHWT